MIKAGVVERLLGELEGSPRVSIPDLSRKYSVPEGVVMEHLLGKGIAKVRRDCWDTVVERIRGWGRITLRVRNDWSVAELTLPSEAFVRTERELLAERDGVRCRVRYGSIAAVYLLEDIPGCEPTVTFCNKKGRCVFEVTIERSEAGARAFRETRGATCIGYFN